MSESIDHRRTGAAALAAGVLLFLSVAAELIWHVQAPDGTVTNMARVVLYLGAFILGAAGLVVAVHGLGGLVATRGGRTGRAATLTGAALLAVFAVLYLGGTLLTGTPFEPAFWLFLLGYVLISGSALPFALGLRRTAVLGQWWIAVLVAGAGALVAILAQSPLHEVGLFTFDAAWAALGLRLLSATHARAFA